MKAFPHNQIYIYFTIFTNNKIEELEILNYYDNLKVNRIKWLTV